MEDSRKKLYDAISQAYNIGTFEEFNSKIDNEESRRKLYDVVSQGFNIGDYDTFSAKVGTGGSQSSGFPTFDDEPNPPLNAYKKQEDNVETNYFKGLGQNLRNTFGVGIGHGFVGEVANLFTGSSREEQAALNDIEYLESIGEDPVEYLANIDNAEYQKLYGMTKEQFMSLDRKERRRLARENAGKAEMLTPKAAEELAEQRKVRQSVINAFQDALDEAGGDLDKAKEILREKAENKTWGDKRIEKGIDILNSSKELRGAAWWGDLTGSALPSATALALSFLTKGRSGNAAKWLNRAAKGTGYLGMGAMSLGTAGMSMLEARDKGASDWQTWAVGLADGMIEIITEKLPFDRLTKGVFGATKAKMAKQLAEAFSKVDSPGRKELEKLIEAANKKLGGKLFSAGNVADWLANMAAESGSEAVAEALQTMTSMIYLEPDKYPTLSDIGTAAWEGAKGGLAMGSILGGAAKTAEHSMNKQRRKDQGFVNVGLVEVKKGKSDVAEIIGRNPDNGKIQILYNGEVKEVDESAVEYNHHFTYNEFETARYKQLTDEAINNGTVSDGQAIASADGLDNARRTLDARMTEAGYTDEQKANAFSKLDASAYPQAWEEIDKDVRDAMDAYLEARGRDEAVQNGKKQREQNERDAIRQSLEQQIGGQFWRDMQVVVYDNGDGVIAPVVEIGTLANGKQVYILSEVNEQGEVAAIREDGERVIINNGMLQNGTQIFTLGEFLETHRLARRQQAEQARMSQEAAPQLDAIRQQMVMGATINLGTEESPIMGTVVSGKPEGDGVLIQTESGVMPYTYEQIADILGTPIRTMTDVQLASAEAAEIQAAEAARRNEVAETAQQMQEAETEGESARQEAEIAEETPLPTNPDGTVNEDALFNQSPARWAEWNDAQQKDGGVSSAEYISTKLQKAQSALEKLQAQYKKEDSLNKRRGIQTAIAEQEQVVANLAEVAQKYAIVQPVAETAQQMQEQAPAKQEAKQQAMPTAEQTLINLFSDDSLSEEEIEAYVDANVSGSQSDLDKHLNKAPKMGRDMEKFKADRAKHAEKTKELTAIRDYWREVKAYLGGNTAEMNTEPQNALEAAAYELSRKDGLKLLPESFRQHTGYGRGEQVAFLSTLRKKENGGMTLEAAGERLMAEYPEFFDENDPNAGLNAILDVLQSAGNSGGLANYIANARQEVARQETDAVRGAIMQQVEEAKKLSEEEASALIENMKTNAEIAAEIELTPENWIAEFGEEGIVETPVGNVKMGENQYLKLLQRKRAQYFGMILPTLKTPDLVLEELDPAPNGERDTKLLFIKTFIKPDGTRYVHFESVTILRDSMEISISSHEINEADLKKKMRNDKVVHLRKSLSVSEWPLNGHQNNGPDLVPSPSVVSQSEEVYNRHTTDRQSAETAEVSQDAEQGGTQSSSSMNTSTASSESKDSNNPANSNESEEKINIEDYDDLPPDFRATDQSQEDIDILAPSAEVIAKMVAERREAVYGRVVEWEKKLGIKVNVLDAYWQVQNEDTREAISQGKKVWGWFEPSTGEVFVYTPDYIRLKPEDALNEVDKTIVHEAVAHKGLREFMGQEKFNEFCDKVWNEVMTEKDRKKFINYPGVNGNTRAAADEYMASISEKTKYNTIWDKIARFFKELLGIETKVSDKDIKAILKQSYANLAKNGAKTNPDSNQQSEGNVRFRTANGSLVGMHNISEEKLRKVIKQGGSANPSTAVIDIARQDFSSYGDISFIMPSSLVDANTGRNAGTFTADAWTPTYPQVSRRFSDDKLQRAYWRDVSAIPEEMSHEVRMAFDSWLDNRDARGLAYMFLHERGEAPEMVRVPAKFPQEIKDKVSAILGEDRTGLYELTDEEKQAVLDLYIQENYGGNREDFNKSISERIQRIEDRLSTGKVGSFVARRITMDVQWMKEHGYNYDELSSFVNGIVSDIRHAGEVNDAATTTKAIDYIKDNGLEQEYERWKESLNDRYGIKEYLFGGYTPSGNQRWLPNTIENASRLMNKEGLAGATGMAVSFNRFVATLAPKKKSLSDIRASKDRLVQDDKLVDDFREKWSEVFFDLGVKCQPGAKGYEDYGLERLTEAAQKKNPGAYLKKEYGVELSQEDLQRLDEMITAIKTEFPARYFETKFQRPVYLNEFAAAVMPTTTSEDVKQAVAEAGLPIFEYDSSVEGSRREATLKATEGEGIRFRTSRTEDEFNATQQEAVKEKGIITDGLWDASVYVVDVPKHDFTGTGKTALKKAEEWALQNIAKEHVYHEGLEDEFRYLIDKDAVAKFLSKSSTTASENLGVHLAALKMLPQIIDNSIDVEIHPDYKKVEGERSASNGVGRDDLLVHRMYGAINIDGKIYRTKTTIHEFRDKANEAYDYKITEIELVISGPASGNALKSPTSVSAAKILKGVEKSYDKGVKVLDVDYIRAVEAGDMETAQRMVNEAARLAGYDSSSDYQGSLAFNGAAPSGYAYYDTKEERIEAWENGLMEDDQTLGDYKDAGIDISNLEWSLTSPTAQRIGDKYTRESIKNLADAVNSDSRKIKVYRAVDADITEDSIRNGDWVTPSRAYAEYHIGLQDWKSGRVIEQEVDIDDIWWDGNDINEWGYNDGKGYAYKNTPNNRKLLAPITYDDNGNVIPLSERFNEKKKDIRFRTSNNNQAIFVSNAAKAVEGIKMEKATPEQWMKMIEKNGGLKAGEDKWMGLSDWLKASDKKTLTKQEVLDFVNEHMIVIDEEHYGEVELAGLQSEFDEIYDQIIDGVENGYEDEYGEEYEDNRSWEEIRDDIVMSPAEKAWEELNSRYHGGDDFDMAFSLDDRMQIQIEDPEAAAYFLGIKPINSTRLDYTTERLTNKHEIALTVPTIDSWNTHDDIHFGDAGDGRAVAWIRFGETKKLLGTTEVDGKKKFNWARVLVIDEIQSKRHQEGRERGYISKEKERELREKFEKAKERFFALDKSLREKYGSDFANAESNNEYMEILSPEDYREYMNAQMDFSDARLEMNNPRYDAVPDAPFDKNWHELAMKRMLRYAAENGYDVIAWTKGDQQNQRYDLVRKVDELFIWDKGDGKTQVSYGYGGNTIEESPILKNREELEKIVGKEIADDFYSENGRKQLQKYNLYEAPKKLRPKTIGGEGMKGFYDKMLPAFMNKYGKKWGVKVEDIALPGLEDGSLTMHSVPVTEEMKSSVMEGQTMFRATESDDLSKRKAVNNIIDRATAFVNGTSIAKASEQRRDRERKRKEEAAEIYSRVLNNQFDDVTLQLIDKYIQDATPKNPYGRRISQRLPQEMERGLHEGKREAAVNALFSRISESAVPEADRASQQGKREIETKKKELLKNWAIASGMWYDNLSDVAEIADVNPIDEGTESKVYASTSDNTLVKVKRGKPFGKRFRPDIDDLVIFNHVFPNTAYTIVGYGDFGDGISTIVTQPVVNFAEDANVSVEERVEHMKSLGFKPMNKDNTAFTNGKIVASDIQGKNIVKTAEGNIRVIDADMKLHTKDMGGKHVIPPVEEDVLFRAENDNPSESGDVRFRTEEEARQLLVQMQDNAEVLTPRQLTVDIWKNEIEGKTFASPIGDVKLGPNQYNKNINKGRAREFGMLLPTIERPDLIFEESAPEDGAERQTKYVFVKTFYDENGETHINYASISVQKEGMEVVESSHRLRDKQVLNKIEKEQMLWNRFASDSTSSASSGSIDQSNALSSDKDSNNRENDNASEANIRYRTVTDQETLDRLNSEPTIKVYRAMQVIDGKLYPPMSAKVDGKLREPIELGQWEEAEERPDLADDKGRFKLDKGNKTSVPARYNPYFHTSRTPLNDQFSSAQTRPNLVTVEVEIPQSELTSGYKAEKAKDSVGEKEWKAGVVQGKLSGTRKVILSRWDKPIRIVPDSEVADRIVEMFEGRDITMPSNVVTPSLRAELEERSIPFVETDNQGRPKTDTRFRATGVPTESVVEDGLRLTPKQFTDLAANIFKAMPEDVRREVVDKASRNNYNLERAVFQKSASLAEKSELSDNEIELAKAVAEKVEDAVLGTAVQMQRPLATNEALWMLYQAVNPASEYDLIGNARMAVVADNLGFSPSIKASNEANEANIRFRATSGAYSNSAANMYNAEQRSAWGRLRESFQDMHRSVDNLMQAIEKTSGKAAETWENVVMALNRLSSKNLADKKKYMRDFLKPMWEKVLEITEKFNMSIEDIERYMMIKHGLERNKVLAARDAMAFYRDEMNKEISRINKDSSLSKAEKALQIKDAEDTYNAHVADINAETDSKYLELREKDYGGLTALYSDFADFGTRDDYETEEQYQAAALAARTPKYKTLAEAERAAETEIADFESKVGSLTDELWQRVNAATKETLKHQYKHNMLSKEQYDRVKDMFEYYVPLRGFADNTAEDMYSYYNSGQQGSFAHPLQSAKGRKTEAESPLGWIGSMAESAIQMDNKNDAKLRLYYFAVNRPDNDLIRITETWYEWTGEYNAEGKKIFEPVYPTFNGPLDGAAMQRHMDAFDSMMEQQAMAGNAFRGKRGMDLNNSVINVEGRNKPEHIVSVKVGGKDYSIIINGNPRAAQAINGLLNIDDASDKPLYQGLRFVLRLMSGLSTSLNPEFWISNLQRDMMFAFLGTNIRTDAGYTKEFAKNYAKAFKIISYLRKDKKGKLGTSETENFYREFSENGGITGYTVLTNNAEYDKMLRQFAKDQRKSGFVKGVKSGFEAITDFGEALEQLSRFAAYMTARKAGKDIETAIYEAKEVTVNFNRKGSGKAISWEESAKFRNRKGKPLNWAERVFFVGASSLSPVGRSIYMFFNASIQGLRTAVKLAHDHPKKSAVWAGVFFTMGMLNAILHAALDDDDDYLDMPEHEKRNNLLLGGNGVYFKWALPQEVRPFYAMADMFVNHAMGRTPHKNITSELATIFAEMLPINTAGAEGLEGVVGALMPSYVSPIYELIVNKNFTGAPIYREMPFIPDEQQKYIPGYTRAYSSTNQLYVNVAEILNNLSGGDKTKAGWININPAAVEHIIEGYGGGTMTTINKLFKTMGVAVGQDFSFRNTPFLSRLITVNDERYRNSYVTEMHTYYKGIADDVKRRENIYKKEKDVESYRKLKSNEDYRIYQIYRRHKKALDHYDKMLKLAKDEQERRRIMKLQDAERRRVIEEISKL